LGAEKLRVVARARDDFPILIGGRIQQSTPNIPPGDAMNAA